MIKTVIFDAYGTLISTGNGSVEATRAMLDFLGVSVDPQEFYREWKKIHKINIDNMDGFQTENDVFVRDLYVLLNEYSISAEPEKVVFFMIESLTGRKAFSDTKDVLNMLSPEYALCIGSTSDTEPLMKNLRENKLGTDYVFTSELLKVYKPKREFYEKILKAMEISSDEAVFVGDSLVDDVMGPQGVGIYSIWLNRFEIENNTNIVPNTVIRSLYELPELLDNLNKKGEI